MATIEERIISMKFQGEQFLAGIDKSLAKLDQFNAKLKMTEGTKGFDGVGAAAVRQTGALAKVADGVQHISDRFKAMGIVGMAALSTLASQAIFTGENLLKSLTVGPIIDGFHEYETNLNSIQTILSNTQAAGTKLKDVTNALDELNHYSDQTIYNFSEMAKNIGTFTAAGVGLKPAVAAIKGIANLAALSGSNSQQASSAMYQLSQAISSGRVSLEDWNSVVNAGMGGTVFQRALAQNAEKLGTLSKGAVKLKGDMKNVTVEGKSFRDSITAKPGQQSWLTSKVLTQTLAQFTGDLSDAALKAQGFNDAEVKAIQTQAKMAKNAATQVKTLTQLLGTIKESVGSGWTQTWQTIFGDFPEAKALFTNANNVIGKYVAASANARNKVLGDWKALGGRTAIINSIGNTFKALISVVRPIKDAFREIFPATTGKQLADISKSIESFTKNLTISGTTANNIKRTFAGFFAVLDIGWQIVKQVVKTIFDLLGVATEGSGGFLKFTGNIGDFLVGLDKVIKSGDGLKNVFGAIGKVLALPVKAIKFLISLIASLFSNLDSGDAAAAVKKIESAFKPFGKLGSIIATAWGKVIGVLDNVGKKFATLGDFLGPIGDKIAKAFSGLNLDDIFKGVASGGIVGIFLSIRRVLSGGGGISGLLDGVKDSLDGLSGTLKAMQGTLKAATLLEIAAAIGLLAVSINILSKIDAGGLTRASTAITVMFGQLLGAMALFEKASTFSGAAKLLILAPALILLAAAVNILANAVKKLAGLSWNELAKGLTGLTVILGVLVATMKLMPNPAGMITTAAGIVILAAGIKILVSAVTDLSGLSWEDVAKGLVGVSALLGALTLFTKFAEADKGGVLQGVGLVLLAAGIKILASAVQDMAGMSWGEIAKGLVTLAGSLAVITIALAAIPPTAALNAAGVLIVALSLGQIADALQQLGSMGWGEIGKGLTTMLGVMAIISAALIIIPPTAALGAAGILVVAISLGLIGSALEKFAAFSWEEIGKAMVLLAGSLGIIAVALNLMTGALPGAAAVLVVAASLAILAPILQLFGNMSWEEMGKGLLMLAGVFTVLGVAGALLTPVIPTLLGLGAAITLIGLGVALAGAGIFLLAAGLTALAVAGAAGTAALIALVAGVLGLIPSIVKILGAALIALIQVIADAAPALLVAAVKIFTTLLTAIDILAPKIINTVLKLLVALVNALNKYVPTLQQKGTDLLVALLNGIARNIGRVVTAATNVIVAFLNAIGRNAPRIQDAGVKLIISLVNGLASAIRNNTSAMQAAGRNLAMAIIDGMTGGLASGVGRIASKAREVAASALSAAKAVLGIHSPSKEFEKIGRYVNEGFRKGLDGNKGEVDSAFKSLRDQLSTAIRDSAKDVQTLEARLKRLKSARHQDRDEIRKTQAALTQARKEYAAESSSYTLVTKQLKAKQTALDKLAVSYDKVTTKLKAANDAYANAVKTRDDFNKSISDQYSDALAPTGEVKVADFVTDLKKQVEDTKSFVNEIQQLRQLGLNDETYKDLLSAGPSALPFMKDLLAGGKTQIDQINALNKELDGLGTTLGKNASTSLYQAAVDSAAGIVKGLQNQQANIEKQMDLIADAMVKSIKKKLGIKSPSRVFAEVGAYTAEGLTIGLQNNANMVVDAASSIGEKALEAMRVSLSNVDKMVDGNIDIQPTIRPVLDLTDIQKNASKIGTLLPSGTKMSVDATFSKASSIAAAVRSGQDGDIADSSSSGSLVSYVQNNYSPKALSPVEIYRGTKNQLSTVKGALSTG